MGASPLKGRVTGLQAVNARGDAGGSETVVDVDDGDVGGATIEHAEERGDAAEAGAVADAGGNSDHRHGNEATDDAGQRAFHSGNTNNDAGVREFFTMVEEAVNPGDTDIVEMLGAVAHHAGGEERFLGDGHVAGSGGNEENHSFSG